MSDTKTMYLNPLVATTRESSRGAAVTSIKYDIMEKRYLDSNDETNEITEEMIMRFFKGAYSNKDRFVSRLIRKNREFAKIQFEDERLDFKKEHYDGLVAWFDRVEEIFDNYEPFTLREAWELKSDDFKMAVFGTVDLSEMLEELEGERYMTEGRKMINKKYDENGKYIGEEENDNIYELWKVKGDKLGMEGETFYIIKVWCTSTNKEHLIWIDDEFKDDPFSAIAGTFEVHENIIPYIKALKRQGDLLIVEMNDEYKEKGIKAEGNKVRLTPNQYFDLMVAQA